MDDDAKRIGPTKREQRLASGLAIRQDFRDAVRFVFFATGEPDFPYATHGGTAFIVNYQRKCYGLTAVHVRKDFDWEQLQITDKTVGTKLAPLRNVYYPSSPRGEAVGSDMMDVVVLEFIEQITSEFFGGTAYILDNKTAAPSTDGHELLVAGVDKDRTTIGDDIAPVYQLLEFADVGATRFDSTLRVGAAQFPEGKISSMTGMSGAPVYDKTGNVLCGMVLRAGRDDNGIWRMHFADIFDIKHLLDAIHNGKPEADYRKTVTVRTLTKI
jgi:hypothetical protein